MVFIHFHGPESADIPGMAGTVGGDIYDTLRLLMYGILTRAAVPVFFVISGYYFFFHTDSFNLHTYKQKLSKRARTILLPYMLWNILSVLQTVALKVGAWAVKGKPLGGVADYLASLGGLRMFWSSSTWPGVTTLWGEELTNTGPVLLPFWFLRDLMVFFLLTPAIYWLIKRMGAWLFPPLVLCYLTGFWPRIPGFSASILFFAFGAYMAVGGRSVVAWCRRWRWPALAALAGLTPAMVIYESNYTPAGCAIYPFFIIAAAVGYIALADTLMRRGLAAPHPRLSRATFFIYALHPFLLGYIGRAVFRGLAAVLPAAPWPLAAACYLLTPALCIALCYCLYTALARSMPRTLGVLTGGRGMRVAHNALK